MRDHRLREGDFFKIYDGTIFEVKGLFHPLERVVAFIRYIPSPIGDRELDGKSYQKVYSIEERYKILKERYPHFFVYDDAFGEYMPEIDLSSIIHVYKPQEKLSELRKSSQLGELERQALLLTETLKREAKIPWSNIGITGSILVRLCTDKSDIDIVIYGIENCFRVHDVMQEFLASERFVSRYKMKDLIKLYRFRVKDTIMPFEDFLRHENRKSFQGIFNGKEFFIRYIKDWNEVKEKYGELIYKPEGYAKIRAKIIDDSESIFTPCVYKITNVEFLEGQEFNELKEIVSFRGRFCEQAKKDEIVIAQGKVERVVTRDEDYRRILLGSKPTDFMITIT
jgi:predicted nucleotidyltransferase